ncbi:MAG: hypothetical protein ACRDR6_00710 [Pseudonocardiaceae bacterium]
MTAEFRHLTATPTFPGHPRRGRVVAAKLITYTVVGLGFGLACLVLAIAIALPWLSAKGILPRRQPDPLSPSVMLAQ